MHDLISKKAAKDMIKNHKSDFSTEKDYRTARACINAVPPARPGVDCQRCIFCGFPGFKQFQTEQPKQQWIPCSERLPEVGRSVLLSVGGMYTAEGCLRDDGDWTQFRWDAIQRKDMVGAWKPLDEPWRGEGQ